MKGEMRWLDWSRRLQSLAQNGLTYCKDPYDEQRYNELRTIAAEIMAAGAGSTESASVLECFKFEEGYATPKIDIRAAVFDDDQILLVKERSDGLWTLPGGWADVGDSPSLAAVREVKEESGFDVVVKNSPQSTTATNTTIRRFSITSSKFSSSANCAAEAPPKASKPAASIFSRKGTCLRSR